MVQKDIWDQILLAHIQSSQLIIFNLLYGVRLSLLAPPLTSAVCDSHYTSSKLKASVLSNWSLSLSSLDAIFKDWFLKSHYAKTNLSDQAFVMSCLWSISFWKEILLLLVVKSEPTYGHRLSSSINKPTLTKSLHLWMRQTTFLVWQFLGL